MYIWSWSATSKGSSESRGWKKRGFRYTSSGQPTHQAIDQSPIITAMTIDVRRHEDIPDAPEVFPETAGTSRVTSASHPDPTEYKYEVGWAARAASTTWSRLLGRPADDRRSLISEPVEIDNTCFMLVMTEKAFESEVGVQC